MELYNGGHFLAEEELAGISVEVPPELAKKIYSRKLPEWYEEQNRKFQESNKRLLEVLFGE